MTILETRVIYRRRKVSEVLAVKQQGPQSTLTKMTVSDQRQSSSVETELRRVGSRVLATEHYVEKFLRYRLWVVLHKQRALAADIAQAAMEKLRSQCKSLHGTLSVNKDVVGADVFDSAWAPCPGFRNDGAADPNEEAPPRADFIEDFERE